MKRNIQQIIVPLILAGCFLMAGCIGSVPLLPDLPDAAAPESSLFPEQSTAPAAVPLSMPSFSHIIQQAERSVVTIEMHVFRRPVRQFGLRGELWYRVVYL
jgi:hypothetical protein